MSSVVAGAQQSLLLAEESDENSRTLWPRVHPGKRGGKLYHRHSTAAVVVCSVEDPIASSGGLHSEVVVMSCHQDVSIFQLGIGPPKQPDDVANLDLGRCYAQVSSDGRGRRSGGHGLIQFRQI